MLFNSYVFLFGFLPIVFISYYMACSFSHSAARFVLIIASFAFYYWWSPTFTILLATSIAFNYLCVVAILRLGNRPALQGAALTFGIASNLALLGYFKYLFPLLHWLGDISGTTIVSPGANAILPLGISFFTFTQIGYLIDTKVGASQNRDPLDFALFVTFFPHLIAGPILHHREMMPQFADQATYRFKLENVAIGLSIFVLGLAKKVLIADQLSPVVVSAFGRAHEIQFFGAWLGAISYTIQLYFDFSGYSDMAVGLARLFGIRFPANFDSPYKTTSIIAFWQRWHMTLTRYLNLYLYEPMALWITRRRMRLGKPINRRATATPSGFYSMVVIPIFYTMGIAGVWHGAGPQYLAFGLLHASYLTINQAARVFNIRPSTWIRVPSPLLAPAKVGVTFLAVVIAFVFFRSPSLSDAFAILTAMAGTNGIELKSRHIAYLDTTVLLPSTSGLMSISTLSSLAIALFIVWALPNVNQIFSRSEPVLTGVSDPRPKFLQWRPSASWAIVAGAIGAIALLFIGGRSEFLYFQF